MNYKNMFNIFKHLLKFRGQKFTAAELGNKFHLSTRHVYRIVWALFECGIPINVQAGRYNHGIWLEQDYKFE